MALDPTVIACPADVWTEVATSVTSGLIHKISNAPGVYKQTYRLAASAAPTNDDDAVVAFADGNPLDISSDAGIDIYIKPIGAAGSVRLDQ